MVQSVSILDPTAASPAAIASYDCGVAPRLPDAIKIYVFSPQRTQVFVESVAAVGLKWIERLSEYKQLIQSVA